MYHRGESPPTWDHLPETFVRRNGELRIMSDVSAMRPLAVDGMPETVEDEREINTCGNQWCE